MAVPVAAAEVVALGGSSGENGQDKEGSRRSSPGTTPSPLHLHLLKALLQSNPSMWKERDDGGRWGGGGGDEARRTSGGSSIRQSLADLAQYRPTERALP